MLFKPNTPLYSYEIQKESGEDVLYINYLGASYVPSLADSEEVMSRTVDLLVENPNVSRIVFVQQRNYSYGFSQISLLQEIAQLYVYSTKQENILSPQKLYISGQPSGKRYDSMNYLLMILKQDPIACYDEIKRMLRQERALLEKVSAQYKADEMNYIRILEKFLALLENTQLIKQAVPYLSDYSLGDREIYEQFFRPDIIPNFTFTRLVSAFPDDAEIVDQYQIASGYDKSNVTILKKKGKAKYIYHLTPPEYTLDEDHHMLMNLARNVLMEHQPKSEEFTDPERTRKVFFNVARDLLQDLAKNKNINLSYSELNKLATILVRHTIGFGLIEVLLQDKNLQDIVLNAPIALNPVFVRHQEFDECYTNVIPSKDDADSWAAKFRMISGRPLDEANPVLDTDLSINNARARVAIIQEPLSPSGLAYAFRRHRDKPWTLPLFIQNKMINPFAAGLMSFLIDGGRTFLIGGTRSSGKTSMLGASMLEIMPKFRTIVIEDSVSGDCKIPVKSNGKFKILNIGDLIDSEIENNGYLDKDGREKAIPDNLEIFSVNNQGKVVLSKPSKLIRHKCNKQIFEIITRSGKRIKTTEDHSLFSLGEKDILKPVKVKELRKGDYLAIPRKLSFNSFLKKIELIDYTDKFNKKIFVCGENIRKYFLENKKDIFSLAYSLGYKKSTIQNWKVKNILPIKIFEKVEDKIVKENLFIKSYGNSGKIPFDLILDKDFLNFVGLWIADGCYDKNSIIVSVQEQGNKDLVRRFASKFGLLIKQHSDGFSLMLNSAVLKQAMEVIGFKGDSFTKKIPDWVYNLSDEQVGWLLQGFFSGDGCVSDKEIMLSVRSRNLIEDVDILLLRLGIVSRIIYGKNKGSYFKEAKDMFNIRIGTVKEIKKFRRNIGFLVKKKQERLEKLAGRVSSHDSSDVIPVCLDIKKELQKILGKRFNKHDYITRRNNPGREHLRKLLSLVPEGVTNPVDPLRKAVDSDIFWDQVKSIKKINYKGYVYDISVPENENFICENIIAHNTLELPVESLRKIGYDILRMKVRGALLKTETEVSADEGIRTSLRLGDSCLIVGEVRSTEAKALYEAMRVGALANVVAGTIHGASPYSVFDRVVNDLEVPVTSFKATDAILIVNPVKTADGLHSWKRAIQLTEVRKHWTEDPLREGGFVDLLKYNVIKDELEATEELINGDSQLIKDIAGQVKGWAGNWDAVYDNIMLRAKVKKEIVNIAEKLKMPELLEADFNALSNNMFHSFSEQVMKEVGLPVSDRVFSRWQKWLKDYVKKK